MAVPELLRKSTRVRWICISAAVLLAVVLVFCLSYLFLPAKINSLRFDVSEISFSSFAQVYELKAESDTGSVAKEVLNWTSSDPSVAEVSENGVITPVGNGSAVISACGKRGTGVANCAVSVRAVKSVTFNRHEVLLGIGQTLQLLYITDPEESDDALLRWSSSDPTVISVDERGVITALQIGEADISVSSEDGSARDTCHVLVLEDIPLEGLSFEVSEFTFRSETDTLTLLPVYEPKNTSQREVVWISSDPNVAYVDEETMQVIAMSNGTTTITAKSVYGDFSASCTVTVDQNIALRGISLSRDSYTFSAFGQTYLISPVFEPVNASNKAIEWESSDPSVASVSDTGVVTSLKNGTAVISLKTVDGGFRASFQVIVSKSSTVPVTGLTLSAYSATLSELGATCRISPTVLPSNATNKNVTYLSKNTAVATVNASGTVTAVGYGTTQIEVRTADGNYTENFVLSVSAPVTPPPVPVPAEEYVRGVWVATVANLNFPSRAGLTELQLQVEIDTIMDNAVHWGMNTVYFQVRPSGDALYPSALYPSSAYVVEKQGDALPADLLAYAVKSAHDRGLKLHAWINPYRVTTNTVSTENLASNNPAVLHPDWVRTDGKKLYLDPGIPEVRQLIVDGVMEIVKNYDVDGVHFDDYFYPEDLSQWDDSAYRIYGNGKNIADWRRENNDALIQSVYEAVKSYSSSVQFGVSPAAVWALASHQSGGVPVKSAYQTYSQCFADTKKWVEQGWLDYICPQVYFQRDHSTAPFEPIVNWWNDLVSGTKVRLYIGIAAYKCETVPAYQTGTEITAQLNYLDKMNQVNGAVFYSYGSLLQNFAGVADVLHARYYTEPISSKLSFSQPSMTLDSSFTSTYIVGISDPNYPLYADGVSVERTAEGYFAHHVKLNGTKTTVRFTHKGETVDYVVTRTSSGSSSSSYLASYGFASGSFTPSYDVADVSGARVNFSCVAPAGSSVYVKVGNYVVDLTTTTKKPSNNRYLKATYTGTLVLPQTDDNRNYSLGYAVFYASMDGESASYSPGCLIEVINDPSSYTMEITKDKSDVRPNLQVTPEVYYIATAGSKVNIVSKADGTVKLTNGMYLPVDSVSRLKTDLRPVTVSRSSLSVAKKYTVLSLSMTDRAFHTVWMGDDSVEITLYGLSGAEVPVPVLGANPLFSSAQVVRVDDTTVRIVLTYKKSLHIYGYYCNFDGTTLYINFRNPASLGSGSKPLEGVVISLDPGHSQSSGAVGSFNGVTRYESTWTLQLSRLTADRLREMGATVVLTHQGEQTYSLDQLIVQYRALSPDLNVSIHFNSIPENANPLRSYGTYTYWCYGNSHLLSDMMLNSFTSATGLRKNRSICDYYKVSRLCEFPSILFETAFISNPNDFAYFLKDENMQFAANAIADGILAFVKEQNS